MTEIENIFVSRIPANILLSIYNSNNSGVDIYPSLVSKQIDVSYSHCVKLLYMFEEEGIVIFDKSGRRKLLKLTNIGREIVLGLSGLRKILKEKKSLNLNSSILLKNNKYTEE